MLRTSTARYSIYCFKKDTPVSYTQLYRWVKEGRKKSPSYQTFGRCLSRIASKWLGKIRRGYFLQDKAYFLHRLKILEFKPPGQTFLDRTDSKEEEKRLKMHFILSYYGNWKGFYRLQSSEQFAGFLSRQNISESALRIRREYDIDDQGPRRHIKEFITDPLDSIEIRIVEEKLRGTIDKISYEYFLPGFNIVEVWKAVEKGILLSRLYALRYSGGN